jgi:hypothetical protein
MTSKAAAIFTRIAKRAPGQPGSGLWMQFVEREMEKAENLERDLARLKQKEQQIREHFEHQIAGIEAERLLLQKLCAHEFVSGIYESNPLCKICGASE